MIRSLRIAAALGCVLFASSVTAHAVVFSGTPDRASFGFARVGGTNLQPAPLLTQLQSEHRQSLSLLIPNAVLTTPNHLSLPPISASATGFTDFGVNQASAISTASALVLPGTGQILGQGDANATSRWLDFLALVGSDSRSQTVHFIGHVSGTLHGEAGVNGGQASYSYNFGVENNLGIGISGTLTVSKSGDVFPTGDVNGKPFDLAATIFPNSPFSILSTLNTQSISDASALFSGSAILDHIVVPDGFTMESASKQLVLLSDGTYAYAGTIPEPSSLAALLVGLCGILMVWRRRMLQ